MPEDPTSLSFFDWIWRRLEIRGLLPTSGGEEYLRLKRLWVDSGTPNDIMSFLLANSDPSKEDRDIGTD